MKRPHWNARVITNTFKEILARQEVVYADLPKCPACDSPQVQCVDMMSVPAKWKCRTCKTSFEYEPPAKDAGSRDQPDGQPVGEEPHS